MAKYCRNCGKKIGLFGVSRWFTDGVLCEACMPEDEAFKPDTPGESVQSFLLRMKQPVCDICGNRNSAQGEMPDIRIHPAADGNCCSDCANCAAIPAARLEEMSMTEIRSRRSAGMIPFVWRQMSEEEHNMHECVLCGTGVMVEGMPFAPFVCPDCMKMQGFRKAGATPGEVRNAHPENWCRMCSAPKWKSEKPAQMSDGFLCRDCMDLRGIPAPGMFGGSYKKMTYAQVCEQGKYKDDGFSVLKGITLTDAVSRQVMFDDIHRTIAFAPVRSRLFTPASYMMIPYEDILFAEGLGEIGWIIFEEKTTRKAPSGIGTGIMTGLSGSLAVGGAFLLRSAMRKGKTEIVIKELKDGGGKPLRSIRHPGISVAIPALYHQVIELTCAQAGKIRIVFTGEANEGIQSPEVLGEGIAAEYDHSLRKILEILSQNEERRQES